ncbi:hypothetical protein ACIQNG_16810 [Streptomyces sp. NPDC091377]|uniref:hypothetical protein n=1 Tax=Streptomyces sp. NPDC091377 TaxID=3365995 RepID=UPI0038218541
MPRDIAYDATGNLRNTDLYAPDQLNSLHELTALTNENTERGARAVFRDGIPREMRDELRAAQNAAQVLATTDTRLSEQRGPYFAASDARDQWEAYAAEAGGLDAAQQASYAQASATAERLYPRYEQAFANHSQALTNYVERGMQFQDSVSAALTRREQIAQAQAAQAAASRRPTQNNQGMAEYSRQLQAMERRNRAEIARLTSGTTNGTSRRRESSSSGSDQSGRPARHGYESSQGGGRSRRS